VTPVLVLVLVTPEPDAKLKQTTLPAGWLRP
jgi:hypothetical protein